MILSEKQEVLSNTTDHSSGLSPEGAHNFPGEEFDPEEERFTFNPAGWVLGEHGACPACMCEASASIPKASIPNKSNGEKRLLVKGNRIRAPIKKIAC